jgi:hypothetical protein
MLAVTIVKKKKKKLVKKADALRLYAYRVKNLIQKNKLVIFNNFSTINIESKQINKMLNSKVINNNIVQGLKIEFPIGGLTKIAYFKNIEEFNKIKNLIFNHPLFKIVFVKIYDKLYTINKFLISVDSKETKINFFKTLTKNSLKNYLFFNLKFSNLINRFYILLQKREWFR